MTGKPHSHWWLEWQISCGPGRKQRHIRKKKKEFHEGTIFNKVAGLKKTNKGRKVLQQEQRRGKELPPGGLKGQGKELVGVDSQGFWPRELSARAVRRGTKQKLRPLKRSPAPTSTGQEGQGSGMDTTTSLAVPFMARGSRRQGRSLIMQGTHDSPQSKSGVGRCGEWNCWG